MMCTDMQVTKHRQQQLCLRERLLSLGGKNPSPAYLQFLFLLLKTASKQEGSSPTDTVRVLDHCHNPPRCLLSPSVIC